MHTAYRYLYPVIEGMQKHAYTIIIIVRLENTDK